MADKVIKVDGRIYEELSKELERFNQLVEKEYKEAYKTATENERRRLRKPVKVTLKEYTETALSYFLRNHLNPRNLGEEKDVITEVKKLRNNVFSFMQVQERTFLAPFTDDVYELKSKSDVLVDNSYDLMNLMEIVIDLVLAGAGLSEQEQEQYRQIAARRFIEKKVNRIAAR